MQLLWQHGMLLELRSYSVRCANASQSEPIRTCAKAVQCEPIRLQAIARAMVANFTFCLITCLLAQSTTCLTAAPKSPQWVRTARASTGSPWGPTHAAWGRQVRAWVKHACMHVWCVQVCVRRHSARQQTHTGVACKDLSPLGWQHGC
jgi:hypothetical protein